MLRSSGGALFRLVSGLFNFILLECRIIQDFAQWPIKSSLKAFNYTKQQNNSCSKTWIELMEKDYFSNMAAERKISQAICELNYTIMCKVDFQIWILLFWVLEMFLYLYLNFCVVLVFTSSKGKMLQCVLKNYSRLPFSQLVFRFTSTPHAFVWPL